MPSSQGQICLTPPLGRGGASLLIMPISSAVGRALHHGGHDCPAQPQQGRDLGVQRPQVDSGHLRGGDLAAQYAPDIGQAHAQLSQGRHQFERATRDPSMLDWSICHRCGCANIPFHPNLAFFFRPSCIAIHSHSKAMTTYVCV